MTGFLENKNIENLKALYFIESKSESIIDEKIKEIKNYFKDKISIENDLKIYDLKDEIDSGELYNFLNTPSFFSIKKVIILKNCEKILKNLLKVISDFFLKTSNPSENAVIFLTSTDFKKASMFKEFVAKFGEVITIKKPETENLKKRILEKAELDGIKITPEALEIFVGNVNEDINILENEYEKLYLNVCSDASKIISGDTVKSLINRNINFTIFNFVDYIGYKNFKMAAELIPAIADDDTVTSGVIKQLFLMFKCVLYIKGGERGRDEAKTYLEKNIKTNPAFIIKILNKYQVFSKNYKFEEIINIISILNYFEIRKRKTSEPNLNFLYSLLSKIQFQ
jgi:DNA polymerase III delta subunit